MLTMPPKEQPAASQPVSTKPQAPGLTMTNAEYHAHDSISATAMTFMDESYAHFKHRKRFDYETATMDLGSAFHTLTLEPHNFELEFLPQPVGAKRNTTIGKQIWEDHEEKLAGRISIAAADVDKADRMAANTTVILNELLGVENFHDHGWAERTFIVTDPATGLQLRCRPDFLTFKGILLDLKSAAKFTDRDLKNSVTDRKYARATAFYKKVLGLAGVPIKRSALVFCESTQGHMVKVRTIPEHILEEEERKLNEQLMGYSKYLKGEAKAQIAKNIEPWPEREE